MPDKLLPFYLNIMSANQHEFHPRKLLKQRNIELSSMARMTPWTLHKKRENRRR